MVQGNWLGTLDTRPVKLRIALKVTKATDGSLTARLDSLDQGAMDLPIATIRQSGLAVAFELEAIGGSYEGTLTANGSELVGEWKQGRSGSAVHVPPRGEAGGRCTAAGAKKP